MNVERCDESYTADQQELVTLQALQGITSMRDLQAFIAMRIEVLRGIDLVASHNQLRQNLYMKVQREKDEAP